MKERKYPFSLFVIGFITNILFHFFWLFIPSIIFMIIGIFVKWCLYVGIGLFFIDIILSFVEQIRIRNAMLADSDNEQFSKFQDAVSMGGNVFENIRDFVENSAVEVENNEVDENLLNEANKLYDAKKYINECTICGYKGYSPAIEEPDFLSDRDKNPFVLSVNKAIYTELTKTFSVLELDEFGRCKDCARIQDKK